MDVSLVAFILGSVNLALLGMLALEVRRQRAVRHEMQELRDAEVRSMIDRLAEAMRERRGQLLALAERLRDIEGRMKSVDPWVDAMTGAQIDRNIEVDGIRERIDALSARLDAVELACGVREKPKTTGGM